LFGKQEYKRRVSKTNRSKNEQRFIVEKKKPIILVIF